MTNGCLPGRALVRLAAVLGVVVALVAPAQGASAAVDDQLYFAALKPDPASRTLVFVAVPQDAMAALTWDFGDGTTSPEVQPSHTFPAGDSFTVRLTATFWDGSPTLTTSKVVQPGGQPPQLQLTAPPDGATFAAGEVVHASVAAPDAVEMLWTARVMRCAGGSCRDEFPDPVLGAAYDVPYPAFGTQGISNPVTVVVYATAASGLGSSARFQPHAKLLTLDVGTPFPSDILLDGEAVARNSWGWPAEMFWAHVGSTVALEAAPTTLAGAAPFQTWSDGNTAATRQFVMPAQATTLNADYLTPIEARYNSDAGLRSLLGPQTQPEDPFYGGSDFRRVTYFQNGRLQWSPATGVHEVHGGIATAAVPALWPITDELGTPDGVGRYNDFENRWSVYWTASTGAHSVHGGIGDKWREYGRELWLGYPTTDENKWMPENVVFQNYSKGGAIYWTAAGGAHEMHGGIRIKWDSFGGYPFLGYPTTDETGTPDGVGRFNNFSRGWSIYWTASTGAHEVHGGIRAKWFELGAERSFLRYPTSDELWASGGRRENFQGGYIFWNSTTGVATAYRY